MYYLKSRYYDPEVCRFINADAFVSTDQGIIGYNMFAYCLNNPVNLIDKTGHDAGALAAEWGTYMWWLTLIDGPLPIGDILYYGGLLILGGLALTGLDYVASNLPIVFVAEEPETPDVEYPGDDPTKAPEGTEWKGKGKPGSKEGKYNNPETGESWHPDLDHPEPVGPHWDYNYKGSGAKGWRVFPDGRIVVKFIEVIS